MGLVSYGITNKHKYYMNQNTALWVQDSRHMYKQQTHELGIHFVEFGVTPNLMKINDKVHA